MTNLKNVDDIKAIVKICQNMLNKHSYNHATFRISCTYRSCINICCFILSCLADILFFFEKYQNKMKNMSKNLFFSDFSLLLLYANVIRGIDLY